MAQEINPWTRTVNPTYQPQSSMIAIKNAERRLRRTNLLNKMYPFIIAGTIGTGLYLSCNEEPKGKSLQGFSQEAYNKSLMPKQY